MKTLLLWSVTYFILGCLFILAAISTAGKTLWNFSTLIFVLVAVFDIRTAFRYIGFYKKQRVS